MISIKTQLPTIERLEWTGPIQTTDAAFILGAEEHTAGRAGIVTRSMMHDLSDALYLSAHGERLPANVYTGTEMFAACLQLDNSVEIVKEPRPKEEGACAISGHIVPLRETGPQQWTFQYGAFPQMLAPTGIAKQLDELAIKGPLVQTGNTYTLSQSSYASSTNTETTQVAEFQFRNQRYVRLTALGDQFAFLSSEKQLQTDFAYWVEVQPVVWEVHPRKKKTKEKVTAITQKAILAGLDWGLDKDQIPLYPQSRIASYLEKHFDREILQSHQFCQTRGFMISSEEKKQNQADGAKAYAQNMVGRPVLATIHPRVVTLGKTYPEWRRLSEAVRLKRERCLVRG